MSDVATFTEYRPLLFSIAYRMLGSATDAEDIVQDTFLRWQRATAEEVAAPKAYLSAVATRLCIDHLRSAAVRRTAYVGPNLPEPLLTADRPGLADTVELAESLSLAFLVLLETLSPVERAAFLLRDTFGYEYAEIARIVGKGEANCRQMVRRARLHLAERRPRFPVRPEQRERLTREFLRTCTSGDLDGLVALLAEDITLWSDGGGKVLAARKPVRGADKVARFLLGLVAKAPGVLTVRQTEVNGQPGFITALDGQLANVLTLDIAGDRIRGIHIVVNPDKLRGVESGSRVGG